jgi:hypothetical protein
VTSSLPPYLWVLNPDAERELSATHSYAVRAAFIQRIAERRALFDGLVQGEPTEYSHELSAKYAASMALFWCPTPTVVQTALKCGLRVSAHPTLEVLRSVHDKRFPTSVLGDVILPGRCNVSSEEEWRHLRASTRGSLRLKRPFGYAGKGQRIWPELGGEDRRWLADSLRRGGFVAEPQITGAVELSLHGLVDAHGLLLGEPCSLWTDAASAPVSIERSSSLQAEIHERLKQVAERAAEELQGAGYFGPFGIDALVVDEVPHLIDLNPRFTLGWSIGMGKLRSEAIARVFTV